MHSLGYIPGLGRVVQMPGYVYRSRAMVSRPYTTYLDPFLFLEDNLKYGKKSERFFAQLFSLEFTIQWILESNKNRYVTKCLGLLYAKASLVANYFLLKERSKYTVYAEDGHSFTCNSIIYIQNVLQKSDPVPFLFLPHSATETHNVNWRRYSRKPLNNPRFPFSNYSSSRRN